MRFIDLMKKAPGRILRNAAGLALAEIKGFDTTDLIKKLPAKFPLEEAKALVKASRAIEHDYRHDFGFQQGYKVESEEDFIRAYRLHVWVFACVRVVATATAGLPLKIYKGKGDDKKEITDHPAVELFDRPNPRLTGYDLKEATATCMDLTGDGYWEKARGARSGLPKELFWLMPDRMTVHPDPKIGVRYYEYRAGGVPTRYDPEDIVHFKYFNPRTRLYGHAPAKAISAGALTLSFYAQSYNKNFFKQGARLSGVFSTDEHLDDDVYDKAKEDLKHWVGGVARAHDVMLLQQGLKFQETGVPPKDIEFPGLYKITREEILAAYGVPPILVGVLEKSSPHANAKEQERGFWEHTMKPKLKKIEQQIDTVLHEFDEKLWCQFDLSGVEALQEEQDARSKREVEDVKTNIITVNEVRSDRGLGAVDWGDRPYYEMAGASMLGMSDDDLKKMLLFQSLSKKKRLS